MMSSTLMFVLGLIGISSGYMVGKLVAGNPSKELREVPNPFGGEEE